MPNPVEYISSLCHNTAQKELANLDTTVTTEEPIGRYYVIKRLAKGGMGEIYLVEDPICQRIVALKKIREDLLKYATIRKRFLEEAKTASKLTHPSIIPIYSVHNEDDQIYYTMPYIEGKTLKDILKLAAQGKNLENFDVSIPALIQLFLKICHAMDYCHNKGVLHRDLKPENILIGTFGEVLIIDWGIASSNTLGDLPLDQAENANFTLPGKIVGTVNFMAPERATGAPSTVATEVYALGVILYQLLTFQLPWSRHSLKEFRKHLSCEKWIAPQEKAPYREIPRRLSTIVNTCLCIDPQKRYPRVRALIEDLEHYIKGYPDWVQNTLLHIDNKSDWEFQENILLTKHLASKESVWGMLMISKEPFLGNFKLETKIRFHQQGQGVGFLLNVPNADERKGLGEGYCVWLNPTSNGQCKLFRNNIEVMQITDSLLRMEEEMDLCIEKMENTFRFYINHKEILCYISHIPITGAHVGFLCCDRHFEINPIAISLGAQSVMVNCLAIPDAFLSAKHYASALSEYRKIASSFEGRAEGRDALFRSGVTLIEMAKANHANASTLYSAALEAFERLRPTAGAPLEYLGKALICQSQQDIQEEVKCLELALRKYPNHPLLHILEEHIVCRFFEVMYRDRFGTYALTLIIIRHLPYLLNKKTIQQQVNALVLQWEKPFFITYPPDLSIKERYFLVIIQLMFFLNKIPALKEITSQVKQHHNTTVLYTALFSAFVELGQQKAAKELLPQVPKARHVLSNKAFEKQLDALQDSLLVQHLIYKGLNDQKAPALLDFFNRLSHANKPLTPHMQCLRIWAYLILGQLDQVNALLKETTGHFKPTSLQHKLQTLYYFATGQIDLGLKQCRHVVTMHLPLTKTFFYQFILGKIPLTGQSIKQLFLTEKIHLYRHIALFFYCTKQKEKAYLVENAFQKHAFNPPPLSPFPNKNPLLKKEVFDVERG